MGKWSTYQLRGGSAASPANYPAPVLTVLGEPDISWTYGGTDPDHWSIETSASEFGPFAEVATQPGASRSDSHTSAHDWVRIIGLDGLNAPLTPYSNTENQF